MIGQNTTSFQQIEKFYTDKVLARRLEIQKAITSIATIIQDILKQVEQLEPRFISTFTQSSTGHYEGLMVHSPYEFEVVLYLNQMGVFNFVDDGSIPGCAVLKLSDGRKRSMSLWVEFITASGYLSARKIRSRFQTLIAQTIDKIPFSEHCKLIQESSDVKLIVYSKYIVQITCAFRCSGIWPRSASQWPNPLVQWPNREMVKETRLEGFDLLSKELCPATSSSSNQNQQQQNRQQHQNQTAQPPPQQQQTMMEGDAWVMSMVQAEERLLISHVNKNKVVSILKTMRDRHLDFAGSAATNKLIKVLVLYECEKHFNDQEWNDLCIGDRIIGILLQMVSCLQCRRCPHFFLPQMDLLKNKPTKSLDESARAVWALVRQLMLNAKALEQL